MAYTKCKSCKAIFNNIYDMCLHEIIHNNENNAFSIFNCINLGYQSKEIFITKLAMMSKEEIINARSPYGDNIITSILTSDLTIRDKEILIAIVNARTY